MPALDWAWWLPAVVAAIDDMPPDVAARLVYLPLKSRTAYGLYRVERSDEPRRVA